MKRELAAQKEKVLWLQEELARAKVKLTWGCGGPPLVEAKEKLRQVEPSKSGEVSEQHSIDPRFLEFLLHNVFVYKNSQWP